MERVCRNLPLAKFTGPFVPGFAGKTKRKEVVYFMEAVDVVSKEQMEYQKYKKKKELKKKLIVWGITALLVMLTVLCMWLYARNDAKKHYEEQISDLKKTVQDQQDQIADLLDDPIVVNPVAPEINLDIITSEIQSISELATVEYLFTNAARFTDSKQFKDWNIPFTEKSFMMKWDGLIKAGVKLDKIEIRVDEENMKITVAMPAAEILSYEVDNDSVEVLDEKDNVFNKLTISDKVDFDAKTEDAMKERAIENGLLDKAQKNAEMIISNLLTANEAIGSAYVIEFVVVG